MKKSSYYIFIILMYLFIFQDFLDKNISGLFGYFDEVYSILFIPVYLLFKKNSKINKIDFFIILDIIIFNCVAILSSVISGLQSFKPVIQDWIIVNKFVLSIGVSNILFKNLLNDKNKNKILTHCKVLTVLFIFLIILDYIFNIFGEYYELRFGLKVSTLFYSHPTYLCASSIFLLSVLLMCRNEKKNEIIYYILISLCIISTLRTKAIIFVLIFWLFYVFLLLKNKKLRLKMIVVLFIVAFLLGESQFEFYFIDNESARSVLFTKSFEIANDYFPIGSGLATYGSSSSIKPYSIMYYKYGLSKYYGLTREKPSFVSDNFWPMIIGQFGYIGLICYIAFLYLLYKKIQNLYSENINYYIAALSALIYPIIMSTSVSAFAAPTSIPLAIVIGICFANAEKNKI